MCFSILLNAVHESMSKQQKETTLNTCREVSYPIAHAPFLLTMINYWLQVDTVTKNILLNTYALCAGPESSPVWASSSTHCLLPPPPSPCLSPLRAPPMQLLNGKVSLLPAFTAVSVYSDPCFLRRGDTPQLLPRGGLQLHSHVCRLCEYSTNQPPTPLLSFKERLPSTHTLQNACGLINCISSGKTPLHPTHVVLENSLETCRQITYKPL